MDVSDWFPWCTRLSLDIVPCVLGSNRSTVTCPVPSEADVAPAVAHEQVGYGDDVLTRAAAWTVMDRLRSDMQIAWAPEPAELEPLWRSFSARDEASHKLWTDDYLAAFALAVRMPFATLDRKIAGRYPAIEVITIG